MEQFELMKTFLVSFMIRTYFVIVIVTVTLMRTKSNSNKSFIIFEVY
jgi:hypothetical protein